MPRILLIIAIGLVLWYLWQQLKGLRLKDPKERKSALWKFIFVALFTVTVGLVLTGRAHWLAAAIAGLLPFVKGLIGLTIRSLPMLQFWRRQSTSEFGPRIKTPFLDIKITLRNGHIDGRVLQGEFADKLLSALDRTQLDKLAESMRNIDREGTMLLHAYLVRRFGATGEQNQNYQQYQQQNQGQSKAGANFTKDEAWQILGLEPGANEEAIVKAHRRLIQKLHPDRGGNDYLAAKVNAAKDRLLDT
jgi:hypothetical protein